MVSGRRRMSGMRSDRRGLSTGKLRSARRLPWCSCLKIAEPCRLPECFCPKIAERAAAAVVERPVRFYTAWAAPESLPFRIVRRPKEEPRDRKVSGFSG